MKKKHIQKSEVAQMRIDLKSSYLNKYYNLWINKYKITGADIDDQQKLFLMREYWAKGSIAGFSEKYLNTLVLTPFAVNGWNLYDYPDKITFINKKSLNWIPTSSQVVDEDAVISYIQPNQKPVRQLVEYFIDRIVSVEMVINTNLQVHKLPFFVAVTPTEEAKAKSIIEDILNDEVVIFGGLDDLQLVKSFVNSSPYIIDKLYQYKISLENELLSYLGIDNNGSINESRMTIDQVNANNDLINNNDDIYFEAIQTFFTKLNELFDFDLKIERKTKAVDTIRKVNKEGESNNEDDNI